MIHKICTAIFKRKGSLLRYIEAICLVLIVKGCSFCKSIHLHRLMHLRIWCGASLWGGLYMNLETAVDTRPIALQIVTNHQLAPNAAR